MINLFSRCGMVDDDHVSTGYHLQWHDPGLVFLLSGKFLFRSPSVGHVRQLLEHPELHGERVGLFYFPLFCPLYFLFFFFSLIFRVRIEVF